MKKFFLSKKFNFLTILSVIILVAVIVFTATYLPLITGREVDNFNLPLSELYNNGIEDAMYIEVDEIHDLVTLTKEDKLTTWDNSKVLLVSWHKTPASYLEGDVATLSNGAVWTFTIDEIDQFYNSHNSKVKNWTLRFEQLIGLPQGNGKTHFSGFWVDLYEVIRPATDTDVTQKRPPQNLVPSPDVFLDMMGTIPYDAWFSGNILSSYYSERQYPWTRLGYTYDWGSGKVCNYGLTEFLIKQDAEVEVAFTKTTDEFVAYLASNNF